MSTNVLLPPAAVPFSKTDFKNLTDARISIMRQVAEVGNFIRRPSRLIGSKAFVDEDQQVTITTPAYPTTITGSCLCRMRVDAPIDFESFEAHAYVWFKGKPRPSSRS